MFFVLFFLSLAYSNDPADSWLNYAAWEAPNEAMVTMVNTTWKVPSNPKRYFGSTAPAWWFGIQTTKGDGALIQPILAYGYQGTRGLKGLFSQQRQPFGQKKTSCLFSFCFTLNKIKTILC